MDVVSEALARMGEQIAILSKVSDELSHGELVALLAQLATVVRTVPALEHQIVARLTAETDPAALGDASWKKVLTTTLRISDKEANRRLARAQMLGPRRSMTGQPLAPVWEATAAAQARGELDEEHVAVIAEFHESLPSWVDVGTRHDADRRLARSAAGLGPSEVKAVARRLAAMIDQDGPEPSDKDVARKLGVWFGPQRRDGTSSIHGNVSAEFRATHEAIWAKEAAPGHNMPEESASSSESQPPESPGPDLRSRARRQHDAMAVVARALLRSGTLGTHNGLPVTVIASASLQSLQKGAGVAVTGGGSLIAIPDLIRMAADGAYHYLHLFDEHTGQTLYLGRTKRLANAAQRIVMHARDVGCTRPGCTTPGYECQAHHAVADWKDDGQTNVDDLCFACGPDNRMVEKTGWTTRKNDKNQTEWIPPPDLDTGQHRVNGYHHPERYLLPEDGCEDPDRPEDDDEIP